MTARLQLSSLRERIAAWLSDLNLSLTEARCVWKRARWLRRYRASIRDPFTN
jgi:hypothetical protein